MNAFHASRWISPSLSMLGWALNEMLENIVAYIERAGEFLASVADDYELILIDDGSTDGTFETGHAMPGHASLAAGSPQRPQSRFGLQHKVRHLAGHERLFISGRPSIGHNDISTLPANLKLLERDDVLQGVRHGTVSWSGLFQRRSDNARKGLVSIVNYLLVRTLFRLPMSDYQNVTVYLCRLIQSVALETESSFTNPECLLKTWWTGASFKEIPIGFLKRECGTAKGTRPRAILAAIRDIFYWWTRWILLGRRADFGRGTVALFAGTDRQSPLAPAGAAPACLAGRSIQGPHRNAANLHCAFPA